MADNMTTGDDDKDDADLYTMDDDKIDGEGGGFMPSVIDEEDEPDDKDDDDDDGRGWEDAYEQEV